MAHQQFASCIEACNSCADECDHCAVACLEEDNPKPLARCIALDIDCAQICRTASAYMARGSEQVSAVCELCADMCEACAEECEKHPMEHCKRCAKACRSCAEECRRMAQQMPRATTTATAAQPAH